MEPRFLGSCCMQPVEILPESGWNHTCAVSVCLAADRSGKQAGDVTGCTCAGGEVDGRVRPRELGHRLRDPHARAAACPTVAAAIFLIQETLKWARCCSRRCSREHSRSRCQQHSHVEVHVYFGQGAHLFHSVHTTPLRHRHPRWQLVWLSLSMLHRQRSSQGLDRVLLMPGEHPGRCCWCACKATIEWGSR